MSDITFWTLFATSATLAYFTGGYRSIVNPCFFVPVVITGYLVLYRARFYDYIANERGFDVAAAMPILGLVVGYLAVSLVHLVYELVIEFRALRQEEEDEKRESGEELPVPPSNAFDRTEEQTVLWCEQRFDRRV
ncbi:MAG: hypothetical protein AAB582_03805 [Patescibacteria group bacterium]